MTESFVPEGQTTLVLTAEIVGAYVGRNAIGPHHLPEVIRSVYATLIGLGQPAAGPASEVEPATPAQICKSITHDALVSFLDGKPYKTLKRHLTAHGLTADTYRTRFGLPADYPMVSPSYSVRRSELAKVSGLGQRPAVQAAE